MAMAWCSMPRDSFARARSWAARPFVGIMLLLAASACASVPPLPPAAAVVEPQKISWEEKLTWILRLEDQRLIRDPNPTPPAVLAPATATRPPIIAPAA